MRFSSAELGVQFASAIRRSKQKGQGTMKKTVLSVIAALAFTSAPAFAADMAVKAPVAPPPAPAVTFDIAVGGLVQVGLQFPRHFAVEPGSLGRRLFRAGSSLRRSARSTSASRAGPSIGRAAQDTALRRRPLKSISTAAGATPGVRSRSISALSTTITRRKALTALRRKATSGKFTLRPHTRSSKG